VSNGSRHPRLAAVWEAGVEASASGRAGWIGVLARRVREQLKDRRQSTTVQVSEAGSIGCTITSLVRAGAPALLLVHNGGRV
jgi:hypothetical protein